MNESDLVYSKEPLVVPIPGGGGAYSTEVYRAEEAGLILQRSIERRRRGLFIHVINIDVRLKPLIVIHLFFAYVEFNSLVRSKGGVSLAALQVSS